MVVDFPPIFYAKVFSNIISLLYTFYYWNDWPNGLYYTIKSENFGMFYLLR
jgi:hypothetical protein